MLSAIFQQIASSILHKTKIKYIHEDSLLWMMIIGLLPTHPEQVLKNIAHVVLERKWLLPSTHNMRKEAIRNNYQHVENNAPQVSEKTLKITKQQEHITIIFAPGG